MPRDGRSDPLADGEFNRDYMRVRYGLIRRAVRCSRERSR